MSVELHNRERNRVEIQTVALVCVALLAYFIVLGGLVLSKRTKLNHEIRRMLGDLQGLEKDHQTLAKDVLLRQGRVDLIRKEVGQLRQVIEEEKRAAANAEAPRQDIIGALKALGKVTDKDLERVARHLAETKSLSSVEEALVILGIVSPEDMEIANQELS